MMGRRKRPRVGRWVGNREETEARPGASAGHRRVIRTGSNTWGQAGMESPRDIDGEEWRMSDLNSRERRAARGTPVPGDARREPEPPPEMPEWLARELFRIFV